MRYWDADDPAWTPAQRDYASAWRSRPKWVASRTLTAAGPYASLIEGELETAIRALKDAHDGEIYAGGTQLARSLGEAGLIDEYRIYLHPVVLGKGTPYFAGPRPPLRFAGAQPIGENVIRLTYQPG
jgi:dihydrofolate reductase